MKAAIYARVSTEDPEREGTPLDSQEGSFPEAGARKMLRCARAFSI